jgi:hypothetical protein
MSGVLATGAAWVALAVLGAFLLARAIRLADRRVAAARMAVSEEREADSVVGLSRTAAARASGDSRPEPADAVEPQPPAPHDRSAVGESTRHRLTFTTIGPSGPGMRAGRPQRRLGIPAEQP